MLASNQLIGLSVAASVLTHEYWRAIKTDAAAGGNTHTEVQMKDDTGTLITITSGMLSQSGLSSFNAAVLVDGTTASGTGFQTDTSGIGSYLQIYLGAGNGKNVHTWIFWVNGTTPATWNIEYSNDGVSWTTVYTGLSSTGAAGAKTATW